VHGRRSAASGDALSLLPAAAALARLSIPVKDLRAAVVQLTTCARETLAADLMAGPSLLLRHAYASNAALHHCRDGSRSGRGSVGEWGFTCQDCGSRGDLPLTLLPRKVCGLCVVIS